MTGDRGFSKCPVVEVEIPQTVSIMDRAFQDCPDLLRFTCAEPESPREGEAPPETHIGARAFQGCGKLAEVVLAESVVSLGTYAFKDCTSLKTVRGRRARARRGGGAAGRRRGGRRRGLQAWCVTHRMRRRRMRPRRGAGVPPAAWNSPDPTRIASHGQVTIPESVSITGMRVFNGCDHLAEVTISGGLRTIARSSYSTRPPRVSAVPHPAPPNLPPSLRPPSPPPPSPARLLTARVFSFLQHVVPGLRGPQEGHDPRRRQDHRRHGLPELHRTQDHHAPGLHRRHRTKGLRGMQGPVQSPRPGPSGCSRRPRSPCPPRRPPCLVQQQRTARRCRLVGPSS